MAKRVTPEPRKRPMIWMEGPGTDDMKIVVGEIKDGRMLTAFDTAVGCVIASALEELNQEELNSRIRSPASRELTYTFHIEWMTDAEIKAIPQA